MDWVAVYNFLSSMGVGGETRHEAYANARADARSYGWNDATLKAIIDGIARAPKETFRAEA